MTDEDFELNPQNVRDYLAAQGFMRGEDEVIVTALGGGVSNNVLLVEWAGPSERRWVIKQSLGKLRVKDDWRSTAPASIARRSPFGRCGRCWVRPRCRK